MPSLHVFGRRWGIASDDFVFPQVTEGILRFIWFVIALTLFALHSDEWTENKCEDTGYVRTYILTLLILNCLLIVLCFSTAFISGKGTILNAYARRHIKYLIYARCPIFVFEIIWNICGSVWVSRTPVNDEQCEPIVLTGAKITVALGWMLVFTVFFGTFIIFDPLGRLRHQEHSITHQRAKRLWTRRLRVLCVCASADDNARAALEEVADLFGDFFYDNDLVLSDVWAGLLLLSNRQLSVLNRRSIESVVAPQTAPPEWMSIGLAKRIILFAIGVYGWPYYVWNNCGMEPWCDILHKIRCCTGCRCDQVLVIRDNCCRCNTASFLLTTNVRETDLFYVSFHDQIYQVPFVACADPVSRSIILTLRGTMSLRDVVTDLCATDESLAYDQVSSTNGIRDSQPTSTNCSFRLHRGMLNVARYVQSTLDNQNILDDLFVLYPEYNLVVTGHSLGAGVAAILSLLLRPKYPNLRCFAFSPPGCVVSEECVSLSEQFICSVVVGDDLVPRMSYQSIQRLKMNIMDVIENCDLPKYELLLKGCFKLLCGPGSLEATPAEDAEAAPPDPGESGEFPCVMPGQTPTEPLLRQSPVHDYGGTNEPDLFGREGSVRTCLHIPGRIMYLAEYEDGQYAATWHNYRKFSDIKMSSKMVTDHMPHKVSDALQATTDIF